MCNAFEWNSLAYLVSIRNHFSWVEIRKIEKKPENIRKKNRKNGHI